MLQAMGARIFVLDDPEKTDETIAKLISENYRTIFLSNEIASFSGDLIKKYRYNNDVNIIIVPRKRI